MERVENLIQLVLVLTSEPGGDGRPHGHGGPIDLIAAAGRLQGRHLLVGPRDGAQQRPSGLQKTPSELGAQHALEGPRGRVHGRAMKHETGPCQTAGRDSFAAEVVAMAQASSQTSWRSRGSWARTSSASPGESCAFNAANTPIVRKRASRTSLSRASCITRS